MYSKTDINNQSKLLLYSILYLMICLLSRDEPFVPYVSGSLKEVLATRWWKIEFIEPPKKSKKLKKLNSELVGYQIIYWDNPNYTNTKSMPYIKVGEGVTLG